MATSFRDPIPIRWMCRSDTTITQSDYQSAANNISANTGGTADFMAMVFECLKLMTEQGIQSRKTAHEGEIALALSSYAKSEEAVGKEREAAVERETQGIMSGAFEIGAGFLQVGAGLGAESQVEDTSPIEEEEPTAPKTGASEEEEELGGLNETGGQGGVEDDQTSVQENEENEQAGAKTKGKIKDEIQKEKTGSSDESEEDNKVTTKKRMRDRTKEEKQAYMMKAEGMISVFKGVGSILTAMQGYTADSSSADAKQDEAEAAKIEKFFADQKSFVENFDSLDSSTLQAIQQIMQTMEKMYDNLNQGIKA